MNLSSADRILIELVPTYARINVHVGSLVPHIETKALAKACCCSCPARATQGGDEKDPGARLPATSSDEELGPTRAGTDSGRSVQQFSVGKRFPNLGRTRFQSASSLRTS